ncbi:hypothetical protein EV200_103638 [Pedobacter psychrotolerans]|uniref:Uncharacterized protein n=1 Tax=Pedobacter psychrotolerans TaxID=1843235 RepID=A0A4R2HJR4_9SPHI|nr:hypothetical protein [Pedobacter psychrotolerans]TCO27303.1 hypothetical protein EV200_103638 [Pedobacter psychrotolerans]GGE60558.1 hypothetical protein GCM10011413_28720 [Pedobacter psychrotolerans]
MMRYLIIFGVFSSILFNIHKVRAQVKGDTVYYLLDTANVPVKDRMFKIEREESAMMYLLQCKCYPYATNIPFYFDIYKKKTISRKEFKKIKIVSIIQLIVIALKCLPPASRTDYKFIFIEPEGRNMKLTDMVLGAPYNPRKVQ